MNFLAHIHLSGDDPHMIVGNFIGDFVKGKEIERFEPKVQNGIQLHRDIDQFTDSNDTVLKSKKRLRPKYRHYSPVIVDVFYDHFLAKNWLSYSSIPLKSYTESFYSMIQQHADILPERAKNMLYYMERDNWLFNYQFPEGINRALTGMSRRTPYDSKMNEAVNDLLKDYQKFEDEFLKFFPVLEKFCEDYRNQIRFSDD